LRYGILLTAVHGGDAPPERQLAEHRELVSLADQLGFGVMVAGQHFLGGELRYYQPIPYLAHMAQHAPRLQVATGIILLSVVNPVDIAEQLATLDALTGGRAIFGAGLGYSDREFSAFGVDKRTRVGRFEEALELIKALWSGERVDHRGRHFVVDGVTPSVRPLRTPPVWIGGQAAKAVARAARMADAWYAPPFPTHTGLRELRELFLSERERLGLSVDGDFPVRRELLIAPTVERARQLAHQRSGDRYRTYMNWGLGGDLDGHHEGFGAGTVDPWFILGPPDECARQLADLRDETGMTHFMFKPQWPGLPHAEAMSQLEAFGTQVMPLLAERTPAAA
jgi:alkanesulfonate monooxygenase SsuD/methylene tetrahydromethanopterin reductase-like flavin-dependent oxidoreductase (luciferase family)